MIYTLTGRVGLRIPVVNKRKLARLCDQYVTEDELN